MNRKHIFFYTLLRPLVILFLKIRFGYRFETVKNIPGNYIVLSNHATDYDPLFVGASFPKQMYYVASEHIARWKHFYKLLDYVLAPIMRYKGTVATSTVMDVLRKVRKGANVCIFAEGVRTWDGVTSPILPSTAKLIKASGCALVTYKLTGGYFVSPGWSDGNLRRGPIHGGPVQIYTKEQLAAMTQDEIYDAITKDLYEDAYARQRVNPQRYHSKKSAESLQNLLFICPKCGAKETISTSGDQVTCTSCQMGFRYTEYGMLEGIPYTTVKELSDWQKTCVAKDLAAGNVYTSPEAELITVANHLETAVDKGMLSISPRALTCGNTELLLTDISDLAIHGRHALVFTVGNKYYELKTAENTNTLKFLLYYEEWKKMIN